MDEFEFFSDGGIHCRYNNGIVAAETGLPEGQLEGFIPGLNDDGTRVKFWSLKFDHVDVAGWHYYDCFKPINWIKPYTIYDPS